MSEQPPRVQITSRASDYKVELGCGTLVIIAIIVMLFSGGKDRKLRNKVDELNRKIDRLEQKIDALSAKQGIPAGSPSPSPSPAGR